MRKHSTNCIPFVHEGDKCLYELLSFSSLATRLVNHFESLLFQVVLSQDNMALLAKVWFVAFVFTSNDSTLLYLLILFLQNSSMLI